MRKSENIFGKNSSYDESQIVLLSVPWSVTASFGAGADKGPNVVVRSSSQMDFFSLEARDIRDQGICLLSSPKFIKNLNKRTRKKALPIIALEEQAPGNFSKDLLAEINQAGADLENWVYEETGSIHRDGKSFGLLGGDHSVSEGAIRYFSEVYKEDLGILHVDAHADLRRCYQGFKHSHASVMYNVTKLAKPPYLVQVGVRDYSEEEYISGKNHPKIYTFFDEKIKKDLFEGKTWSFIVEAILDKLPKKIYISLDVDGLDPALFPHTGTPVPGGLSFDQMDYLLKRLIKSLHHEVIGFDLVEIASPEKKQHLWDGQVGARLLYKLCQALVL